MVYHAYHVADTPQPERLFHSAERLGHNLLIVLDYNFSHGSTQCPQAEGKAALDEFV